ncbi:hypothetical protein N9L68_00315 [bacterium]|nr:hypothetical protein [bacterium]
MVNALTHTRPVYRKAIDNMQELIDKGQDPKEARGGAAPDRMSAVSGPDLADLVRSASERGGEEVDIEQLSSDLSFLQIDKAKIGSDILRRMQKMEAYGGIRMYAEVFKWLTETSGLGFMEHSTRLMIPNRASKEEHIPEAILLWEEKVNR